MKAIVYIHGQGGNAKEADQYKNLFEDYDVIGFDYFSEFPWEAETEFQKFFDEIFEKYETVEVIANSIGAFFTMIALKDKPLTKAYFISPIVDMEKLISDMMTWANVTKEELFKKGEIKTDFGKTLSFKYLSYAENHPVSWNTLTHILYGEKDSLTSYETISSFAKEENRTLCVMKNGEHWFHTKEQLSFLDSWIRSFK